MLLAQITLKSPLNCLRNIRQSSGWVGTFIAFQYIFETLHEFLYIPLMFAINLSCLWHVQDECNCHLKSFLSVCSHAFCICVIVLRMEKEKESLNTLPEHWKSRFREHSNTWRLSTAVADHVVAMTTGSTSTKSRSLVKNLIGSDGMSNYAYSHTVEVPHPK